VAAPHGGGIEPGTTEIARAIAGADLAFYSVEGIKRAGNADLHITSRHFDEPRYVECVARYEKVIAIHGCDDNRGSDVAIWVGGGDRALVDRAVRHLASAGYAASIDTFTPGDDPANLCNRGRSSSGLQLELSRSFRSRCFKSAGRMGRKIATSRLEQFAGVIRALCDAA
jgi:phage replication-related protein YjqB (UPF0714/DUF867 family)